MPRSRLLGTLGAGLLLALLLAGAAPLRAEAPEGTLEAGFAVVDLTPRRPVPLGGYAARLGRPFLGIHDPVRARAAFLRRGEERLAIVSLDLVGVSASLREILRARLLDLDLDDLVLVATHNHAGPGALTPVPLWRPAMGPFDPDLFARTVARVEAAVRRAHADLAPCVVGAGRGGADRGARLQRNRETPGAPVDGSVGVVRIDAPDGSPRGLLVHFAAHPTLIPASERRLGAGWPGALCDAVERRLPGATAIFLNGAMGDVAPVAPPEAGSDAFARARAYGETLARIALDVRAALPSPLRRGGLQVQGTRHAWAWTAAGRLLGRRGESALAPEGAWPLPVARFAVGDVAFVTVPGEPVQAAGRALGAGDRQWVVSCAQDHLGYFADRALYRRGGYAADLSLFGPDAVERLRRPGARPAPPPFAAASAAPVRLAPAPDDAGGAGGARRLGRAHGRALGGAVRDLLRRAEAHLREETVDRGAWLPLLPAAWALGLPPRDLVLPSLVRAARRLQPHVAPEHLEEMEGLAEAAGVPYDAILLENVFLTLAEQQDPARLLFLPARCTNLVALGEATSMGQVLHASTLDWGMGDVLRDRAVVLLVEPEAGHPFVSVTWPGMVGTLRAMGAQGLAVTEESCAAPGDTGLDGTPVNLLLRRVVQHASSLPEAVAWLRETPGTCGYKVTVSDGRTLSARVVELTARRSHVRRPRGGLVFGCDPEAGPESFEGDADPAIPRQDASSARRYPAVRALLAPRRTRLRLADVQEALALRPGGVLGPGTLLACVFEPQVGRWHVALRDDVDAARGRLRWRTGTFEEHLGASYRPYRPPWPVRDTGPVQATPRALRLPGLRVEDVEFDSPVRSGVPENDRVRAELFLPEDPVGVVVQLPAWRDEVGQRLVALLLTRRRLAVLVLPLPFQMGRAPPGTRPGTWTLSHDLARTREALLQGAADAVRAGLWLERERGFGPERQGVMGISLGGHVAALVLGAYPERFRAGAFLLAGGRIEEAFLRQSRVTGGIRRRLVERGVTVQEALDLVGPLDPARYGRPADRDRVLLVGGEQDEVVPPESVRALAEAWGGARTLWYAGGHYGAVLHAGRIVEAVTAHFRHHLEEP